MPQLRAAGSQLRRVVWQHTQWRRRPRRARRPERVFADPVAARSRRNDAFAAAIVGVAHGRGHEAGDTVVVAASQPMRCRSGTAYTIHNRGLTGCHESVPLPPGVRELPLCKCAAQWQGSSCCQWCEARCRWAERPQTRGGCAGASSSVCSLLHGLRKSLYTWSKRCKIAHTCMWSHNVVVTYTWCCDRQYLWALGISVKQQHETTRCPSGGGRGLDGGAAGGGHEGRPRAGAAGAPERQVTTLSASSTPHNARVY